MATEVKYYAIVHLDKTNNKTGDAKWRAGRIMRATDFNDGAHGINGGGIAIIKRFKGLEIHQQRPSIYCEVEPRGRLAAEDWSPKSGYCRCEAVKCVRWLTPEETNELAGFPLWDLNHFPNPLERVADPEVDYKKLAKKAAKYWHNSWSDHGTSLPTWFALSYRGKKLSVYHNHSFGYDWHDAKKEIWESLRGGVFKDLPGPNMSIVVESLYNFTAAHLFSYLPDFRKAKEYKPYTKVAKVFNQLWEAGYLLSYDGAIYRVHVGKDAESVYEFSL